MSAIINDTFTGPAGNLESHTPDVGGAWSVAAGGTGAIKLDGSGFAVQGNPNTSGVDYIEVNATTPSTADVVVSFTLKAGSANQIMGAVARRSGTTYYNCRFNNGTGPTQWEIYAFKAGIGGGAGYVLVGTYAQTLTPGTSYNVVWTISGTSHTMTVGGVTRISATDANITTNGSAGLHCYLNSGTGADFAIDTFTVADPAASNPPSIVHATVTATSTTAEISWEPVTSATLYTVYRAPTAGGTYASVGTVTPPSQPYYVDSGYSAGNTYKVTATVSSTETAKSAETTPVPYPATGLSAGTLLAAGPGRHNVLVTGSTFHVTDWSNLHYTQKFLGAGSVGPPSSSESAKLFDDKFTASAPLSTLATGTLTSCGVGGCTVSASASNWATLLYPGHAPGPNFGVTVDVANAGGDVKVGYGLDATHGVFARYKAAGTIDIYGVNGGTETSLLANVTQTLSGSFRLAIECCNTVYCCWVDTGTGWTLVGSGYAADAGTYDLRTAATLASWAPIACAGNGAGTTSTTFTRMRCNGFGGTGRLREMQTVTYPDGAPVRLPDGRYLVGADRNAPVPSGIANVAMGVGYAVHPYDPETYTMGDPIATLSFNYSGRSVATQECKIVYDPDAGGYHVWSSIWSTGLSTDSNGPTTEAVWYQFYTGYLTGLIHLSTAAAITLPAAMSGINYYGVDVFRANGVWYMAGTRWNDGSGNTWKTVVISGSSANSFGTVLASDTTRSDEGHCWFFLGDRIYLIAGAISVADGSGHWGLIHVWDFSDLATLTYLGTLDYPNPNTTTTLPQQPTILWYKQGGKSVPQLLGFSDAHYDAYADAGPLQVCEPSFSLNSWQFPLRGVKPDPVTASGGIKRVSFGGGF